MAKFKTKLTGARRTEVVAQGRDAAKNGWERKSPYHGCRAEEAWYDGFDEHINNPSTLVHCTICGRMHNDAKECPTCGDTFSQRTMGIGETIYMTKQ